MKKQVLFLLQFFILTLTFAQPSELIMKSGSKGYYLEHTTAVHEGLYPIGRMYNVHPKHIAGFNSIDINKGLSIGQKINIPLSDTNFNQTGNNLSIYNSGANSISNSMIINQTGSDQTIIILNN